MPNVHLSTIYLLVALQLLPTMQTGMVGVILFEAPDVISFFFSFSEMGANHIWPMGLHVIELMCLRFKRPLTLKNLKFLNWEHLFILVSHSQTIELNFWNVVRSFTNANKKTN
jgi:hypothetical protein